MSGNTGSVFDEADHEPASDAEFWEENRTNLFTNARQWAKEAAVGRNLNKTTSQGYPAVLGKPSDAFSVRPTVALATYSVSGSFFAIARERGITLYEPFGGMCAGLEAVLRNGIAVNRYLYSDSDPAARSVAHFRVDTLAGRFPTLFSSYQPDLFSLPQDV